jgi:hypothetical protein
MKKIFFICLFLSSGALFQGCSPYGIAVFSQDEFYGSSCPAPIYVATMSHQGKSTTFKDYQGNEVVGFSFDASDFTLVNILKIAKEKYGQDVTISNIRYDVKGKKKNRKGVIFDVIRCNSTPNNSVEVTPNDIKTNNEVSEATVKKQNIIESLTVDGSRILYGETEVAMLSVSKYPKKNGNGIDKGDLNVNFANQDFLQKHRTEVSTILQTYYPAKNWNLVMVVTSQSTEQQGE